MRDYKFLDKPVFTLADVREEFNSEPAMFSAIKRAMDRGEVRKLAAGLYCTLNEATRESDADRFEIAAALRPDGFCAYRSALEFYGLVPQRYDEVQVISKRQESPVTVADTVYRTYRCRYFGGVLDTVGDAGAPVRVATLERTVLDCLDRTDLCGGLQEVVRAFGRIRTMSEDRLVDCLEGFDLKILYKKAGYILSVLDPPYLSEAFYSLCMEKSSTRLDDLRPMKGIPFVFNTEWNMYVPSFLVKKRTRAKAHAAEEESPAEVPEADSAEVSADVPAEDAVEGTVASEEAEAPAAPEEGAEAPPEDTG